MLAQRSGASTLEDHRTGFPEGAAITTPDTLYLGFGVEGIAGPDARAEVLSRGVRYLLR